MDCLLLLLPIHDAYYIFHCFSMLSRIYPNITFLASNVCSTQMTALPLSAASSPMHNPYKSSPQQILTSSATPRSRRSCSAKSTSSRKCCGFAEYPPLPLSASSFPVNAQIFRALPLPRCPLLQRASLHRNQSGPQWLFRLFCLSQISSQVRFFGRKGWERPRVISKKAT